MDALDAGGCPDIMAFPRQILFSCGDCSSYVRRHGSRLIVLAAWHLWSLEWVGKHHCALAMARCWTPTELAMPLVAGEVGAKPRFNISRTAHCKPMLERGGCRHVRQRGAPSGPGRGAASSAASSSLNATT